VDGCEINPCIVSFYVLLGFSSEIYAFFSSQGEKKSLQDGWLTYDGSRRHSSFYATRGITSRPDTGRAAPLTTQLEILVLLDMFHTSHSKMLVPKECLTDHSGNCRSGYQTVRANANQSVRISDSSCIKVAPPPKQNQAAQTACFKIGIAH